VIVIYIMSSNQRSAALSVLENAGIKYAYSYTPGITYATIILEVPINVKLPDQWLDLIKTLEDQDAKLTPKQADLYTDLYKEVLQMGPSTETNRPVLINPTLQRSRVIVRIIESDNEDQKTDISGKMSHNLTKLVSHFQPQRLKDLKARIAALEQRKSRLLMCAITGVAGCGKSEVAKAYAWDLDPDTDPRSTLFFRWRLDPDPDSADNQSTKTLYRLAYEALLYNFGITSVKAYETETDEQMHNRLRRILWQRINQYSKSVIIFDNAFSYDDIKPYICVDADIQGVILVTTQNSLFFIKDELANLSITEGLDLSEGLLLLRQLAGRRHDGETELSTKHLVVALDCSPLGITVAGVYLQWDAITFTKYIERLKDGSDQLLIPRDERAEFISQATEDTKRKTTLRAALKLAITKLKECNPPLLILLRYCAFLANDRIPSRLLEELLVQQPENYPRRLESSALLNLTVLFKNLSLLAHDNRTNSYDLHRTTQVALRKSMDREDLSLKTTIIETLVKSIRKLYSYHRDSVTQINACISVSHHMLALLEHSLFPQQRIFLIFTLGRVSQRSGRYAKAEEYFEKALEILPENPDEEMKMNLYKCIGETRHYLGKFELGIQDLFKSLKIAESLDTPKYVIADIHNLMGYNLRENPNSSDADALNEYMEALKIEKEIIPATQDSNYEMAYTYNGIGQCLKKLGQLDEAMANFKSALNIYIDLKGDNTYVLMVYHNMAILGLAENIEKFKPVGGMDYPTSLQHIDNFLQACIRSYGSKIYNVALCYQWKSQMLYVNGDLESALDSRINEINTWIDIIGERYEQLIQAYYWKGRILEGLNRNLEAQTAYQQALSVNSSPSKKAKEWIDKAHQRTRSPSHGSR
jgi:tetratricopeptide (TPR) repeat protein